MSDDYHFDKIDNYITPVPFNTTYSDRGTSMDVFSLQIPLFYTHYFGEQTKWGFTLGAFVNFNTGAHVNQHYTIGDDKFNIDTGKIGQRPVTVDGIVMLRTPWLLDFYCRYCPMKYFRDGRGPSMHQLSFGVCF